MNSRGITLMETLVTLAIFGITSVLAVPNIGKAMLNSNMNHASIMARSIISDVELYVLERGFPDEELPMQEAAVAFINEFNAEYASTSFDLSTLNTGASSFYVMSSVSVDPWGTKYVLYYSRINRAFVAASAGANTVHDFLPGNGRQWKDDVAVEWVMK